MEQSYSEMSNVPMSNVSYTDMSVSSYIYE